MIGSRARTRRGSQGEAEKPFWISFADLMTALMVLFLVVMAVALLAVTRTVSAREALEAQHKKDVDNCMAQAVSAAKRHTGVKVDLDRRVIDFGGPENTYLITGTLLADQAVDQVLTGSGATIQAGATPSAINITSAATPEKTMIAPAL